MNERDKARAINARAVLVDGNYEAQFTDCNQRVQLWLDSGAFMNQTTAMPPSAPHALASDCDKHTKPTIDTSNDTSPIDAINNGDNIHDQQQQECDAPQRDQSARRGLADIGNKYMSFDSDISTLSFDSVTSLLEHRRRNPEELLLALGFGDTNVIVEPVERIPERFLGKSNAKGIDDDLEQFLKSMSGSSIETIAGEFLKRFTVRPL